MSYNRGDLFVSKSGSLVWRRMSDLDIKSLQEALDPFSRKKSQGQCETTNTTRFANFNCTCPTYPGNLGPCEAHDAGSNGRCVYCDHELTCKPQVFTEKTQKGGEQ